MWKSSEGRFIVTKESRENHWRYYSWERIDQLNSTTAYLDKRWIDGAEYGRLDTLQWHPEGREGIVGQSLSVIYNLVPELIEAEHLFSVKGIIVEMK